MPCCAALLSTLAKAQSLSLVAPGDLAVAAAPHDPAIPWLSSLQAKGKYEEKVPTPS